jgi:hypothetical protein
VLDETQDSSRTRSGRTFRQPVPEAVQARPSQNTSPSVAPENRPKAQTGTLDGQMTEVQAKAYMADQVRRWERDTAPPEVKYDWPQVRLNPTSYISAVLTTSEYLRQRLSMATQADAWVSEMQLRRRTFGTARDLTAALIPPGMFSPRECVAVLQTLLFEAGFGFVNLVPGWFRTRANKVHPDLVRRVVGEMLQLLVVELIEWRQVMNQASKILVSLQRSGRMHQGGLHQDLEGQAQEEVRVISVYEANLLEREYIWQLKAAGFWKVRSPRGSEAEPEPQRVGRVPARALHSSIPSPSSLQCVPSTVVRNLEATSSGPSMSTIQSSSGPSGSSATSSLFGLSGGSDESMSSAASSTQTSRDSTSGSSGWSIVGGGGRMAYAPPGHLSMTVQGFGGVSMETGVGMYVIREAVLTHLNAVDQEDAVMVEEPTPAVRKKKSKTTFGRRSRHRDSPSSSDESGSEDHRRPHRRSHSRASMSGRRSPSSRSSR